MEDGDIEVGDTGLGESEDVVGRAEGVEEVEAKDGEPKVVENVDMAITVSARKAVLDHVVDGDDIKDEVS